MVKYLPETAHFVLDVGCGSGNLGAYLQTEKGCIVWGIEPKAEAALEAERKLSKVVHSVFDNKIDLKEQKFDAIFFNDVLEHLIDPLGALKFATDLLNPFGVIISSIPNIRYFETQKEIFFEKDWKYTDDGILDKTHLRFFTSKSIQRMYAEAGYEIIIHEGINSLHSKKLYLLEKILPKYFNDMKFQQFTTVARPHRFIAN